MREEWCKAERVPASGTYPTKQRAGCVLLPPSSGAVFQSWVRQGSDPSPSDFSVKSTLNPGGSWEKGAGDVGTTPLGHCLRGPGTHGTFPSLPATEDLDGKYGLQNRPESEELQQQ